MKALLSSLLREHEHGLVHLLFINDAAVRLFSSDSQESDISIITDSLLYIRSNLIAHCREKETRLFCEAGKYSDEASISELISEHQMLGESCEKLHSLISCLKEATPLLPSKAEALKSELKHFTALLNRHIKKENQYCFKLARDKMSVREVEKLFKHLKGRYEKEVLD